MNVKDRWYDFASLTEEQKAYVAARILEDNREYIEKLDSPIVLGESIYRDIIRRVIDIVVSGAALIVTAPVNLFLLIGTFLDVGSPIFFKQDRVGKNGKVFQLTKFRNMTNDTDDNGVLLPPNQRITKFGMFVRKTSMDELLNFWCIFKGDMSILGPRPLPVKYYKRYSREHNQRHLIKPGLECPFHDDGLTGDGWRRRFDNDIWYVRNIGLRTDFIMMLRLVKKVFTKEARASSANGQDREFVGYDAEGNIITSNHVPLIYLQAAWELYGNTASDAAAEREDNMEHKAVAAIDYGMPAQAGARIAAAQTSATGGA